MNRIKAILKKITARRGMTFIELLIAVLISFIILAAIFEVFIAQKKRYVTEDALLEVENRGDFAIEYLTRMIQNSGFNIKQGMKIETASDHYFTTVMDEDDNGVIEPDEIITISLNKPYREIAVTEQPTELVHDADLDDFSSGDRKFSFDVFFDMNGNGTVADTEKFTSGYDLNTARDDNSLDQKDAIKLYLSGPPYAIYRYSYRLNDEASAYGAGNPYIVNPEPDLISDNVDNFIIRYYDEEDLPLPVTTDNNGNRITPNPPYVLSREEMAKIRRVDFELLLRSARKDVKWTDAGFYPAGSVASYGADGKPVEWTTSCGDPDFRDAEPYLTNCAGLSDWDCFIKFCNNKQYPALTDSKVPYQDNYRRLLLSSSVTPKNLILNPYGQLIVTADPPRISCPDTFATLTATLKDRQGDPIPNAVVNFYSTSLVSALDYTGVSNVNGDGKPITDANGVVTGIRLNAIVQPDGKKKPVTVTISADSSISVTVDGVVRLFPVYSSAVVPFVVGPPVAVEFINAPPDTRACSIAENDIEEFVVHAKDCNDFDVEGAVIVISPNDPAHPNDAIPSGFKPGNFYSDKAERDSDTLVSETHGMADYSDSAVDNGKYRAWYEPPQIDPPGSASYFPSLLIRAAATEFELKKLTDPEPAGWGYPANPIDEHNFYVRPGALESVATEPDNYSGAGCRNNYLNIYVSGYDCGNAAMYPPYDQPMWGSILAEDSLDSIFKPSPPLDSDEIMGTLTKTSGGGLGMYNVNTQEPTVLWDENTQKYRVVFLNTGCATSSKQERVEFLNYEYGTTPPADAAGDHTIIDMNQCPVGLNITLRAREPHTADGSGTLTDGFYQNGCDFNNVDVEALVILNLPPDTLCEDVELNPVTFTVESGGARFLDASNNPTLTAITVNTDTNGTSRAPLKLTGTSLADVVIRANSSSGTAPVYTAEATITLPVGPEHIVFAYRDNCYTDLLSPSGGVMNGDYVYVELKDCNKNDNINAADTATVTAYEFIGSYNDTESFTLTETGNSTGIFRGKIKTRALPVSWTPTDNDGILDLTNAGQLNIRYLDEESNVFLAYDEPGPYIPAILDLCEDGIKFMEVFSNSTYDGLTSDMTNFPFVAPASWRGFSTLNITSNTTPALTPNANTFKKLMLQVCDEFYLSGSIFTKFFWNGGTASFPPSTTPDAEWRNTENFMWVDLDESVVGDDASEQNWTDLVVSYRFQYIGSPDDTGYTSGTTVTVPDYYLPGVTKGVYFFFRTAASSKILSSLPGSPTMNMIDRGYVAVWTKDTSGNPVAKLFRIDGVDTGDNPLEMEVVQVGGDITAPDFTISYDSPGYHKAEIVLDEDDFFIYFDDVFLDFDGESGPSAVGGSSAIDKNYVDGTVGFGVKDVIAKFDNIQVCGCPPMVIETSNPLYPYGVGVTLTMKDALYGTNAPGPVTWSVDPDTSGAFGANPSTGASVIFTRNLMGAFPTRFDAVDALGCVAMLLPPPPAPTCMTQDFEAGSITTIGDGGFESWVGTWVIAQDASNGNSKGIRYTSGNFSGVKLIRASYGTYGSMWDNHSIDTYDDYTVEIDVRPTSTSSRAGLYFRNSGNAGYYLMISNDGGNTRVRMIYDPNLTTNDSGDEVTLNSDTTSSSFSTSAIYRLKVTLDGSTIQYEVKKNGVVIEGDTITSSTRKTGGPGFRLYNSSSNSYNAYFDNFRICSGD
jgi:type II secretory pathway pseudopilin PulG